MMCLEVITQNQGVIDLFRCQNAMGRVRIMCLEDKIRQVSFS